MSTRASGGMIASNGAGTEHSPLDLPWAELSSLGHRMIDDVLGHLASVAERPIWQPIAPTAAASFEAPPNEDGQGLERAYLDFLRCVLPYSTGNTHPRFWGWVMGSGSTVGALADFLSSAMNCNVSGFDDAAGRVEAQVLAWCKQLLGFPSHASGLLTSGCSTATLIGLAVARQARAGFDVRARGLASGPTFTFYASTEVHVSVVRAIETLGFGSSSLRRIPVDADYRISVPALRAAIATDRAAGLRPLSIIGNAGTVNTGAFDDLAAIAAVARAEELWFHVDGAFGALAALSPRFLPLVAGMSEADSLAFDFHKWMYLPYGVGCVLVRDAEAHRRAFAFEADYIARSAAGAARSPRFGEYGLELSRAFRALKVWMCLKTHGVKRYREMIERNVDQAQYLARLVTSTPMLELLAPAPLNVVCFRYRGAGAIADLDAVNLELLYRLHASGLAVPSYTVLGNRYALRVAVTNHRSRYQDFDLLVEELLRLGKEIA